MNEKESIIIKVTNERKTKKKNRNDVENANEKNTCNIKTRQKQNDHDHEREYNENIRLCIECQITTQFEKNKNIKLNNSMNSKLSKRTSIFNNFRKKKQMR